MLKTDSRRRSAVCRIPHEEGEAKKDVADSAAFAASFASEPQRYSEGMAAPTGGKMAKFVQL